MKKTHICITKSCQIRIELARRFVNRYATEISYSATLILWLHSNSVEELLRSCYEILRLRELKRYSNMVADYLTILKRRIFSDKIGLESFEARKI